MDYTCTMNIDGVQCKHPVFRQLSQDTFKEVFPKREGIHFLRSLCETHIVFLPEYAIVSHVLTRYIPA